MDANKTPTLKLGCSCWGIILTSVIVFVRAFQSNAVPISEWSWQSWIWMTIPIWLPIVIGLIAFISVLVFYIWTEVRD